MEILFLKIEKSNVKKDTEGKRCKIKDSFLKIGLYHSFLLFNYLYYRYGKVKPTLGAISDFSIRHHCSL